MSKYRRKSLGLRFYEMARGAAVTGKAKLAESERFQQIKRDGKLFFQRQGERLSYYVWKELGLEDVLEAGLRYSERQLLKYLERLKQEGGFGRQLDGIFDEVNPLIKSYRLLGVPYGCDFSEVKRAYREKMRRCHPDMHAGNRESEKRATLESQAISEAYDILARHYGRR